VNDPVVQGFISSPAHPGSNITGFTFIDFEIIGKWVSLNDVVPDLRRVALMFDPDTSPYFVSYFSFIKAMKQTFLGEVEAAPVRSLPRREILAVPRLLALVGVVAIVRLLLWRCGRNDIVRRQRPPNPLQLEK
jgi:putative ABC transport system substrate-binding protein